MDSQQGGRRSVPIAGIISITQTAVADDFLKMLKQSIGSCVISGSLGAAGLWCASLSDYDERSRELDDTPCLRNSVLHPELRH